MDTEIEVTDTPEGRCAEITKQRDLSSKGERIGFRLDQVPMGFIKWGKAASSCVVVSADAPVKTERAKKPNECNGAVLEYLLNRKVGMKKGAVVEHFNLRYQPNQIYRAIKALTDAGALHQCSGMVCAAGAAK